MAHISLGRKDICVKFVHVDNKTDDFQNDFCDCDNQSRNYVNRKFLSNRSY